MLKTFEKEKQKNKNENNDDENEPLLNKEKDE